MILHTFNALFDVRSFFSVKKIDLLDRSSYVKDLENDESRLRQCYVFENFERDLHSRREVYWLVIQVGLEKQSLKSRAIHFVLKRNFLEVR